MFREDLEEGDKMLDAMRAIGESLRWPGNYSERGEARKTSTHRPRSAITRTAPAAS